MQQVLERPVLRSPAHPASVQERVLVGADESGAGHAALRWAAGEAFRRGALLTVARAIAAPPHAAADRLRWETGRRLHHVVSGRGRAAAGRNPGTGRGSRYARWWICPRRPGCWYWGSPAGRKTAGVTGSVTRYCLLHAHCPVVLVPEEAVPEFSGPRCGRRTAGPARRRPPLAAGGARRDAVNDTAPIREGRHART